MPPTKCDCSTESTWLRVNDYTHRCSLCGSCVDTPLAHGHSNLSSAYLDLYNSGVNVDVTFKFPDGEIRAHKLILTTRVPYFEKMFAAGMKESLTNEIDVPDANRKSFDTFLRFIYGGQLPDDFDAEAQLGLAQKYDVPGLLPHCVPKLKEDIVQIWGADTGSSVTEAKMDSFGKCIVKAAQIMRGYAFPAVTTMLEQELHRQLNKIGSLFISNNHGDNLKKLFVVQLVELLIVSHVENSDSLKTECFRH